ncbi:MAG: type II toxin-antitoxin system VapC family toxin [Pyrinomonadaceae bacterium]
MSRIYLDACIIIYIVEKHPIYSSPIETLINNLTETELCYSPLSRLECLVMPFRTKDSQLSKLYKAFFNAQRILAMPKAVFDEAAQLRADFSSLKTPDALHLATAIHHNCDEFWTNDNRLEKVKPKPAKNILST